MISVQCDIKRSLQTRVFSIIVYCVTIVLILYAPWSSELKYFQLIMLIVIACDFRYCQKRISATKGLLTLRKEGYLFWQDEEWYIGGKPLFFGSYIFILLKSRLSKQTRQLCLASDCMSKIEWRCLRYELLCDKPQ